MKLNKKIICVIGLGYVGLPLAIEFSKYFKVIGFDIDKNRVIRVNNDNINLELTSDPTKILNADFVIIAVPTPVSPSKEPNLSYVRSASKIVGQNLNF